MPSRDSAPLQAKKTQRKTPASNDPVLRGQSNASIDQARGGPAEMVPGQHHLRLNMYIARARNGRFKVVENLGVVDPKEKTRSARPELSAVS
jgi:branched-chain amino acid transport system substrate-binding protein